MKVYVVIGVKKGNIFPELFVMKIFKEERRANFYAKKCLTDKELLTAYVDVIELE